MADRPVDVAAGLAAELPLGVGDGELPDESVGDELGLIDWIDPGVEDDGTAPPDDLVGLQADLALSEVEPLGPSVDCDALVPVPLPWDPPLAPPPPPVERGAFEALGEIPC